MNKRQAAAIERARAMDAADEAKGRQLARDVVSGTVTLGGAVFGRGGWVVAEYRGFISELVRMAEKGAVVDLES